MNQSINERTKWTDTRSTEVPTTEGSLEQKSLWLIPEYVNQQHTLLSLTNRRQRPQFGGVAQWLGCRSLAGGLSPCPIDG